MPAIEEAKDEAQLEACSAIRVAVDPDSPISVEELDSWRRAQEGRAMLLARDDDDGAPAGYVVIARSSVPGRQFTLVRVDPARRRRGIGSALYRAAVERARADGLTHACGHIDEEDEGSLAAVVGWGLEIVARDREAVLDLRTADLPDAAPPAGIELTDLAARPDLVEATWRAECVGVVDVPAIAPLAPPTWEHWHADLLGGPDARPGCYVVALADGEVVASAGISARLASPGLAENQLTMTIPAYRGRGIAYAVKLAQAQRAKAAGFTSLVTWNDSTNAPMIAVNTKLGYVEQPGEYRVDGPIS